jgi:flagellar assembly protein FliH
MTSPPLRRFDFDTVFDDAGGIASQVVRQRRMYTPEEVEAARTQAFAEGERSAVAKAEAAAAGALRETAQALTTALGALAEVAQAHKEGCAELSLVAARAIADAALDAFPDAPAAAALQTLIREVEAAPRLIVRTSAADPDRLRKTLEAVAANAGMDGQVTVKPEPGLTRAAFVFDWGDGKAAFDPDAAAARVSEAVTAALVAEGLHGDPLPLPGERS